jgi:hypothetical protein
MRTPPSMSPGALFGLYSRPLKVFLQVGTAFPLYIRLLSVSSLLRTPSRLHVWTLNVSSHVGAFLRFNVWTLMIGAPVRSQLRVILMRMIPGTSPGSLCDLHIGPLKILPHVGAPFRLLHVDVGVLTVRAIVLFALKLRFQSCLARL